jgi:hypothetical protein
MKEFVPLLRQIEQIDAIQRIIPWRVARTQGGSGWVLYFTLSYETETGLKYMMKKGGTAQECFVLCADGEKTWIIDQIQKIVN